MSKGRSGEWRNQAASDLLIRHLPELDPSSKVLVMEDLLPDVATAAGVRGGAVTTWSRRAYGGRSASPWPPSGPFHLVALRLPRGKDEVLMSLHAAASVLGPGGSVLVYGAKDEGIQSAAGSMAELFSGVDTLAIGGRCRVLRGIRRGGRQKLKASLEDWKVRVSLGHPSLPDEWVSYPGIFAQGHLDPGTRLLIDALPPLPAGDRVLDYGSGSGILGWVARSRGEDVRVELLDLDSVALEAARENVPGARILLNDGLPAPGEGPYDLILTNPPFHRGKAEDPGMVLSVIEQAGELLHPEGRLVLVAQRRLRLEGPFQRAFRDFSVLAVGGVFAVMEGRKPLRQKGRRR